MKDICKQQAASLKFKETITSRKSMFNEDTFQVPYFSHHQATYKTIPNIFIENMETSKEPIELAALDEKSCVM